MNILKTALGATALLASAATAEELKVFNWAEYIGPGTIEKFEAETGIDVIYDTYESVETLETRILAGGSGFDLVFVAGPTAERFISAGLLQEANRDMLPNHGNLDPAVMSRIEGFDPGAKHIVPYLWGTIGIGYNPAKLAEVLPDADTSDLALIFDPANTEKLASCGLGMLDSPNEVLGIALNYLGEEPYGADKAAMQKAEEMITAIRPHVRYFDSIKPIDDLATGEICVGLIYSGDAGIAALAAEEAGNGVEVLYSIPKQGTLVWVDSMAILADAENSEAAHKFIEFMLRPEIIAETTNYLFYANANVPATELVNPEITGDPSIYPTAEVLENLFPEETLGNKSQRLRTRTWTRIKTGN